MTHSKIAPSMPGSPATPSQRLPAPGAYPDTAAARQAALASPKSAGLSDRQIAEHCGVGHALVSTVRGGQSASGVTRTGKDGRKQKSLYETATRIHGRAIKRAGELLREIEPQPGKRSDVEPRAPAVPKFALASPPPTVTALAERGKKTGVEAVAGKQAVQLATVAPAQSPPGKKEDQDGDRPLHSRSDKRLRAILRAPAEVQELYRDGAISQTVNWAFDRSNQNHFGYERCGNSPAAH